jgi:flagellar motility protein MotE (MotC chaperone)
MAGKEENSERSYNIFERLFFYSLPLLFSLLLAAVLLSAFGYDVLNTVLRVANEIPVVSNFLPDPKPEQDIAEETTGLEEGGNNTITEAALDERIKTLEASLKAKDEKIISLQSDNQSKEKKVNDLKTELDALKKADEQKKLDEAQYVANIQKLAQIYSNMSTSKAAPVMESLTLRERLLVLKEMKPENQVKILEKMDPGIAAETSILLKDIVPVKDLQIAALQERLSINGEEKTTDNLTKEEISRTYAQMEPARASDLLLEIASRDQGRAVSILLFMDEASRAEILNLLTERDKVTTAKLIAQLG